MLPFNQPALDLSEFAVAGREQAWFDVFAWSGRDLYRPGETVRLSALLRDQDGQPVAAKGKALQSVFVRYVQPDGKTFLETKLQPDAQGYVRHTQVIPVDAATGRWRVEFRTDPASKEAVQGMTLRVEEFLPERMKLDLTAQDVIRPGEPLRLQATGAYLYGAPAASNRFTAKLTVAVEQHPLEQLPGWFFGDPTLKLPKEAKDVIDAQLDANGKLQQTLRCRPKPSRSAPSRPWSPAVSSKPVDVASTAASSACCGPRTQWSVFAHCSTTRKAVTRMRVRPLNSVVFGSDGKPRPGKGLRVTLVREHRDYHWNWNDDSWDYDFTRRYEDIATRVVDAGSSPLKIDFPWSGASTASTSTTRQLSSPRVIRSRPAGAGAMRIGASMRVPTR
jgi:uncharacterized protein YfaS (alpha-2-macroglobulin family)